MREKDHYSLSELLCTFDASASGYRHHHSNKMTSQRARQIKLVAEMKAIHKDSKLRVYGSPRMTEELKSRGFECS